MEIIMQHIPPAVSAVLVAVLILTVIIKIVVEVLKKVLYGKCPVNVLALIVAMTVTLLAVCQIIGTPITWYLVAGGVGLGFAVAFAAMFGFDRFRQTLEQINKVKDM